MRFWIYPVVMDLLEVFVDGIITRQHGDGWEEQVEQHQREHVGHIVPADLRELRKCYYVK